MGSGSSKKGRPFSASDAEAVKIKKQTKLSALNIRSTSFPSKLSSLRKESDGDNEVFTIDSQKRNISHGETGLSKSNSAKLIKSSGSTKNSIESHISNEVGAVTCCEKTVPVSNGVLTPVPLPLKTADINIGNDRLLWTVTDLYNVLTAESWLKKPLLARSDYILLLDCRIAEDYKSCHITTAKHHRALHTEYGCLINVPGQLQSYDLITIYDDIDGQVSNALKSANVTFFTLNSSFQLFKNKYPFLCTKDIINAEQREKSTMTWPSEIIEGEIYQGNATQALDEDIITALGITHIINVTLDHPNAFPDKVKYMRIQLDDEANVDLLSWLSKTTQFISDALDKKRGINEDANSNESNSNRVLIHCNMGRSRSSTIMLGYLMEAKRWTLQDSSDWLKDCRQTVKPNVGFINQLLAHEERLFGRKISDFNSLPF